MRNIPPCYVRRYWFGTDDDSAVADTVLLMERDRLEQYKAALDVTLNDFRGVFAGITGLLGGRPLSVVSSIGPAHIADCVNFLAHGFGVQRFFATGSIGGLDADMGDIVVSNTCATQDGYALAAFPTEARFDKKLRRLVNLDMGRTLTVSDRVRARTREAFGCEIQVGRLFTVPAVSSEDDKFLDDIRSRGFTGLDLETGPFLAACRRAKAEGTCIHWVTDLPLSRSFYYQYEGDPMSIQQDRVKKHKQWLNMPRLILPILSDLLRG
jgi:uridine phosphorylase